MKSLGALQRAIDRLGESMSILCDDAISRQAALNLLNGNGIHLVKAKSIRALPKVSPVD